MYSYKYKLLAEVFMENYGENKKTAYTVCSVLEGIGVPSLLDKTFVYFIR